MAGIVDDYADKGEYRHGKKTWASICEGGQEAAVYDSIAVNYLLTLMLKRHFRNEPGYSRMLELYAMVISNYIYFSFIRSFSYSK